MDPALKAFFRANWESGRPREVEFWREWIQTRGGQWPQDYQDRLDPDSALRGHIAVGLEGVDSLEISILDVGAGPLTVVGKRYPGKKLRIVPIDALADEYDRLLDGAGVVPPVRTTWCPGELLDQRFPAATFDLAYAQNSLDHCYDPVLILRNMLTVVKPGRKVLLVHYLNEGSAAGYGGLHQWNFGVDDGEFVVWNRLIRQNVTEILREQASVSCSVVEETRSITVVMKALPRA